MNNYFECVASGVWNELKSNFPPFVVLVGFILIAAFAGCILSGSAGACIPVLLEASLVAVGVLIGIAILLVLMGLLLHGSACLFVVAEQALVDASVAARVGRAIASNLFAMDCVNAQAELDRLVHDLNTAIAARDARAEEVARARRRLNAATAAFATAVAAVASAPFWHPELLVGAIAATVAAGALVARRSRQLVESQSHLSAAEANLAKAAAAVAAATIIVDNICGQDNSNKPADASLTEILE